MNTLIRIRAAHRRAASFTLLSLCMVAMLGGCAHSPAEQAVTDPARVIPSALGELPAQYAGTLPCDDCGGIAYWLTLGSQGVYVLQQHYNTDDAPTDYVEVGRWQSMDNDERLALTPADSDGSGTSLWGIEARGRLVALDGQGRPIEPAPAYTLHRRGNTADQSFVDTPWHLVNAPDAHTGADAYIRFSDDDQRLTGSTGCNDLTGRYAWNDDSLSLSDLSSSDGICLAFEDTEQSMLEALRQTHRARVLGNYLLLLGAAGDRSPLAIFQARTEAMPLSH